jgi:hypothetical protein
MTVLAQPPLHRGLGTRLALTILIAASIALTACSEQPKGPGDKPGVAPKGARPPYYCKDRSIHIDKSYGNGVDKDPVVLCIGMQVKWNGDKHWTVDFTTPPFDDGKTTHIDETTDQSKLYIKDVGADDAAFKYSVTPSGGTTHDPQIIIMGGS